MQVNLMSWELRCCSTGQFLKRSSWKNQRAKISSRFCVATASGLPSECLAIVLAMLGILPKGIESKTLLSRNPQLLLSGVSLKFRLLSVHFRSARSDDECNDEGNDSINNVGSRPE